MRIFFHRSPARDPGTGLIYQDFERWMKKAVGMEHLSEEAQCGGPLGRAPLLGTVEDMLTLWHQNFLLNFSTPCI